MSAADAVPMLAGAALLGIGGTGGWAIKATLRNGRCFCGHPVGCGNAFGECTRKIRVRNYAGGRRAGWKYEPCKCRDHAQPKAVTP